MVKYLAALLLFGCGEIQQPPSSVAPATQFVAPTLGLSSYSTAFGTPHTEWDCAVDDLGFVYIVTATPPMIHKISSGGAHQWGVAVDDTTTTAESPRGIVWEAGKVYVATRQGKLFCYSDDGAELWGHVDIPIGPITNGWAVADFDIKGNRWVAINSKERRIATGVIQ